MSFSITNEILNKAFLHGTRNQEVILEFNIHGNVYSCLQDRLKKIDAAKNVAEEIA